MPELPEVETLCRQLQNKIAGNRISSSAVYDPKLAHLEDMGGNTIVAVRRKGKSIEMLLNTGASILIHLRMTGRLLWQKETDRPKHTRWQLTLPAGNLYLIDPRRFATVRVSPTKDASESNDPILNFDEQAFIAKHGRRKTKVKNLLLDQNAVSGIGNIYACEILHAAGVHPEKMAAALTKKDWAKIFRNAKSILAKAIEKRGTSISDWRDLHGLKGENQFELKAYGQVGEKCVKCGTTISRIKQGGRSTFYCPTCQR